MGVAQRRVSLKRYTGHGVLPRGGITTAMASSPRGIVLGPDGDLYVVDVPNNTIRRVTTAGVVSTYAGSGTAGFADGPAATAQFDGPFDIAATANGDLIVTDQNNHRVRRVLRNGNTAGAVETLAGSGAITDTDGPGATAGFPNPGALVVQGNAVFVSDGKLIRQVDLSTRAVTTLTGAAGNVTTIAEHNLFEPDAGTGVLAQLPFTAGAAKGGRCTHVRLSTGTATGWGNLLRRIGEK